MIDVESSPHVLPPGYRIVGRFAWLPVRVAGRRRRLESVRVVQRIFNGYCDHRYEFNWFTVGFWEEVAPTLAKPEPLEV